MLRSEPRFGLVDPELEHVVEQELLKYKHGTVVDIGCGPFIPHLRNKAMYVDNLIGVDNNHSVIDALRNHGIPNFTFNPEDATAMSFPDNSIDLALLFGTYSDCRDDSLFGNQYTDDELRMFIERKRERLIREVVRVVSPTGKVILSNSKKRTPFEDVKPRFEEYFNQIKVHVGPERYLMVCSKG